MTGEETPEEAAKKLPWWEFAPAIGCAAGGCFIPALLFCYCLIVLGDIGGPLFWPIIAAPLALVGMLFGFVVRSGESDLAKRKGGGQ